MKITEMGEMGDAIMQAMLEEKASEITPMMLKFILEAEGIWDQFAEYVGGLWRQTEGEEPPEELVTQLRNMTEFAYKVYHRHNPGEPCGGHKKEDDKE